MTILHSQSQLTPTTRTISAHGFVFHNGTYWLGLHNGPLDYLSGTFAWHVSATSGNNRLTVTAFGHGVWFGDGYWATANKELTFQLSGYADAPTGTGTGTSSVVPLPSAAWAGLGLLGLLRYQRRKAA